MRAMLDAGHQLGLRGPWRDTLALQQFAYQPESGLLLPAALPKSIENVAIGIDDAP